jgi:hypothetical protein
MESWRLKMESWRHRMEPWKVCRPVVVVSYHLDEEQHPDAKSWIRISCGSATLLLIYFYHTVMINEVTEMKSLGGNFRRTVLV